MRNATYLQKSLRREPGSEVIRKEYQNHKKASAGDFLWIPAILIFGVGDILTTQVALSLGAVEGNNLVSFILEGQGGLWLFGMVKAVILIPLALISLSMNGKFKWIVPCFLCCLGICLLGANFSVIFRLL